MRNMDQEKRDEFTAWMTAPLAGQEGRRPSPFTEQQEADGFMGLLAMTTGKKAV